MNNCSLDQLNPFEDGVIRCSKSKSLISDITKYLNIPTPKSSKNNVELGLEIEINESVQRVLRDEDTSNDDLLAVTIIRPSDSKLVHETTVALSKDDVKEFIALVERHRNKHQLTDKKKEKELKKTNLKKELKEKVKKGNKTQGSGKNSKKETGSKDTITSHGECKEKRTRSRSSTKYHATDVESKEVIPSPHTSKYNKLHLSTFGENAKQVYTTINTFDKLKEVLPCQNKYRTDKPGVPCICPNCGIMDVLVQSQKGPVVEFPPLDEVRQTDRESRKDYSKHSGKRETKRHAPSSLDIDILKEINVRINNLEKRLALQEETAVNKDYLKHVLHKIFAQYRND